MVQTLRFNRLTLTFPDPTIEQAYLTAKLERSILVAQSGLGLAFVLFAGFAVLDWWIIPEILELAWSIRLVCCLVILATALLIGNKRIQPHYRYLTGGALLICAGGILAMIATASVEGSEHYFAGLLLVVVYGYFLTELKTVQAALICILLLPAYNFVVLAFNPIEPALLINNNFFLLALWLIAGFGRYSNEFYQRRLFVKHQKLEAQNHQIAHQNEERKALVAILCHDLANPINAVQAYLEMLDGEPAEGGLSDLLKKSVNNGLGLLAQVRESLKKEDGAGMEPENCLLRPLFDVPLAIFQPQLDKKNITVQFDLPDSASLWANKLAITNQVLTNLLGNAIKFSHRGAKILIKGSVEEDRVKVKIRDFGVGISPGRLKELQLDQPEIDKLPVSVEGTEGEQGTGFGLYLVKKYLAQQGGTFEIESRQEPPETGTQVIFTLPASKTSPNLRPAADDGVLA